MGNHRVVKVKRLIPAGANNPNVGKPYYNMEERLKEMFYFFDLSFCEVPIAIRDEKDLFSPHMDPTHIIGFVHKFSDTDMDIEIMNEELFGIFKDPRVEIVSTVDKDRFENEIYVDKVLKLIMSENPDLLQNSEVVV